MKKKIVAIIPIKLKNERLPGKNVKLLGNKPLIQYIQESLLQVADLDEIYVYCSNEDITPYLLEGVSFLKRPQYLDEPTSNFTQIFQTFRQKVDADIYIYAHATAPFVSSITIEECMNHVLSGEYDSAFTAEKIQDFLWQDYKPLNFDAQNVPRSQDIPPIYRETSGVYVFQKEVFDLLERRVGNHPLPVEVDLRESVDINYPRDFTLAEILLKSEAVTV